MKLLKRIVLILAGLVVLFVAIGFLLPSHFRVERSTVIQAPAGKIFAQIDSPAAWKTWTVWNQRDPAMRITYSGPTRGVNAAWQWESATEGNGKMTFTAIEPDRQLTYKLEFPDMGMVSTGIVQLEAAEGGTRVRWTNEGELGGSPVNRYFGLLMDRLVGPDFESGLANLKARVEQAP
ncbi:SRPBCC family protein [Chitinimonas sp. BJYL2]|uniref:SRPBCC family protein n=1 Tax=Chitinimonas sp. BJYL2 TaxID=2976696 RepID=UPI0022B31165|nr:SRPBCC family protein [Chitinimonas sp. BJYL2]